MTAYTNITQIVCDGRPDGMRCPSAARDESLRWSARELRDVLADRGWEAVEAYDLPTLDRCPACGTGTA